MLPRIGAWLLLLFVGLASGFVAQAAVYTWTSTTGGTTTTDGAGTWVTTSANWRLNNAGTAVVWPNNNDAIIGAGGTPGTITLSGNPVVNNVTFNAVGSSNYILTASTLRIGSSANQVVTFTLGSGVIADLGNYGGSGTYLREGAGNNGIIFTGGGTMNLTYTGTATPFTGPMTVSGASVFVGAGYSVAANTNNLTSGTLGSYNNVARAFTKPTTLRGNFTLGAPSPRNGNLTFGTGAFRLHGGTFTVTVDTITVTNNSVIVEDGTARGLAVASANGGKMILNATETYTGDTTVSSGTLVLGASGALNAASGVNIAAGAKFDVTSQATWTLGSSATLKGSGTATNAASASTIAGGTTVDVGTRPIVLNFTPTGFSGDTTHPSLFLETGTLSLSGNAFTVTNTTATPLGTGTYRLIEQAAGSITSSGSHSVTVAGSGVTGGSTASISVSGGFVNLLVSSAAPATQIQPETAADGTGSLVSAQTVNSGNSITVYAIARAADNSFVSNSTAVWSLQNVTGGVVSGNLVPSGDTKSAVFTGNASGTANIRCTSGALTATDSGTITVTCGTATVSNPSSQTVATGSTATFTVSAGSSSLPTYQWRTNGVNISGATSASYTTPAATLAMDGLQYSCVVSVACDSSSATSAAATLSVADPSNTSFRSAANGLWSATNTWQMSINNGGSWFTAILAPSDSNSTNITIQAAHTVTSSGTASADDLLVAGKLTVSGGSFTIANGAAAVDAAVTGAIESSGGTITSTGALQFESGGYYAWTGNAGPLVPTATWADGSLCAISNTLSSANSVSTGVSGQNYYDFTVAYPAAVARRTYLNITGTGTVIRRNFNISIADLANASVAICTNTGTILTVSNLNFSAGTGTTSCKALFNASAVSSATIVISGTVIATGTVDAFTTTTLQFPSGTHPLSLPSGGNYVNSSSVSYQVDAGASVTASNALGSSAALTLNGTLTINGAATFTGPNTVGSAGVFRINFNGGTVPTAVWPTGSRVEVLGATTASPGGLEQTLNDLTWDSAAQSQAINMTLASTMTVNGTLHLKNSNAKEVRLTSSGTPTVSVGTLHVESGILTASSGLGQTTLNVTNNLAIDSGATLKAAGGAGMSAINLVGTLSNSGTLNLALNRTNTPSATKLSNAGTINAGGTLTVQNNGPTPQNGDIFDLFDGTLSGTFATVNLPTGGTTHWDTSDLYVGGTIKFTNAAPAASDLGLGVSVGGTATAIVIGKFATDADGDTLTITSVSSPTSGTATISGGNVIYTNTAAAASDSFTYTVSDGVGGTATKTVTVTISSPEGYNKLSGPTPVGGGQYQLDYLGIPGQQYALDETSSLAPPITWTPLLTNTAAGNGSITFTVTPANPSGFFRTRSVP